VIRRSRRLGPAVAATLLVALVACGDLPDSEADVPPVTVPSGVLAAVPFQNRLDVAQGIFQVKIYNGTDAPLAVESVQLRWTGLTTPASPRRNTVAAGDRIDFPVLMAPATCDHGVDTPPSFDEAVVRTRLADGTSIDIPAYDVKGMARKLYVADCERQFLATQVAVTWVDLDAIDLDGRPVTAGRLRVDRLGAVGPIAVVQITNTVNFTLDLPAGTDPVVRLDEAQTSAEVPVTILEGRCDAHARSESSQPFAFSAIIDLGDGRERVVAIPPPLDQQPRIRARYEEACDILGTDGFVGE
jgi:hypothetical protein